MTGDDRLLRTLRRMWNDVDPAPAGLADRMVFAVELADVDVDVMTAVLAEELGLDLMAARGEEENVRTVTFRSASLSVMITLSASDDGAHRLDGWIVPAGPLQVELRTSGGSRHTCADDDGRFVVDGLPSGLLQLVLHATDGAAPRLTRPVVTPAVQL